MKIFFTLVLFLILHTQNVYAAELTSMQLYETPRSLPNIVFNNEKGAPLKLSTWRGKFVLLNIWATWCGPCRAEMPTLDRLQAKLGNDRFEVVTLSIDRAGVGVVRKFFDEIGIKNLRIYIDESGRVGRDLKIFGLPGTLLIGPDGRELGRLIGPAQWDSPELISFFQNRISKNK